jgi:hypothetical protein
MMAKMSLPSKSKEATAGIMTVTMPSTMMGLRGGENNLGFAAEESDK